MDINLNQTPKEQCPLSCYAMIEIYFSFCGIVFRSVFTNGDVLVPPARIRIPKYTLRSWENVLALVTEKVHLRTGAVYR